MAVTKATYTATATWTAVQLADVFKTAFIDAGLMTDWYDSFLNTVENRVLEVVYDGTKTYGTVYYWFMFTTGGVFIQTALGWNATTHVPTGSQYLDYFATTTNATTNHRSLIPLTASSTATVTRYTSAVDTDCSWFLIRSGTNSTAFMIPSPGFGPSAFVDQNKVAFNGMLGIADVVSGSSATGIAFLQAAPSTRRTYLGASSLRNSTTSSVFTATPYIYGYVAYSNNSNSFSILETTPYVRLPNALTTVQSALASNHLPIYTAPTASPYMPPLPSDFGITAYYASNSMAVQDTLVVSAGVEEWEMVDVSLNSSTDAARMMFLARTV